MYNGRGYMLERYRRVAAVNAVSFKKVQSEGNIQVKHDCIDGIYVYKYMSEYSVEKTEPETKQNTHTRPFVIHKRSR